MNHGTRLSKAALAAALACLAPASFAIDLVGSYEKALRYDPTMLAAGEAVVAGREKAVQGRALLKPQLALSASLTHVTDRSSTSLPAGFSQLIKPDSSGAVHKAALQAKQPIVDADARASRTQLQQQTELAEVGFRNAQQELIQRVGEAYFNVLLAQESLRVTQAEKAAVALQRDRSKARFDVGRGKITDLQEAEARYDGVVAKEVSAQSTLSLAQAQYEELTGVAAEGLADLAPGFVPVPAQPQDLQAWQRRGLDANTRVLVSRGELAIATAEIDKYRLKGRPTLDLVASYTTKGQSGGLSPTISADRNRSALIGLEFNLPLYTGGGLDSKERESIAKKRQAEQELAAAQRDARLQVHDAFVAVQTGVSSIGALEQTVRSAQTALQATTLGRDVGTRTELDVLDAQQRLYAAQLDLAQARNDYLLGRIRLSAAAGELQPGDLQALNAYLSR